MFIYLIFILNLIQTVFSTQIKFQYLNENEVKRVEKRLEIFCSSGQHISLTNALMSSYIHFLNGSKKVEVFSHENHTKIYEHFTQRQWTPLSKWLDITIVTNLMIPSFRFHCIGIASEESYDLELRIQSLSPFLIEIKII